MRPIVMFALAWILAGCASGPKYDLGNVDQALTPRAAVAEADVVRDREVVWGGVIIEVTNLADGTRLEVLSYPLNGNQRPRLDQNPMGRFLAEFDDYLEPAEFANGRLVTVLGRFENTEEGKIGESAYIYPVLVSNDLFLWPKSRAYSPSNVRLGIGIGFGL